MFFVANEAWDLNATKSRIKKERTYRFYPGHSPKRYSTHEPFCYQRLAMVLFCILTVMFSKNPQPNFYAFEAKVFFSIELVQLYAMRKSE